MGERNETKERRSTKRMSGESKRGKQRERERWRTEIEKRDRNKKKGKQKKMTKRVRKKRHGIITNSEGETI